MEPKLGDSNGGPDQRPHPRISALEPGQMQSWQEDHAGYRRATMYSCLGFNACQAASSSRNKWKIGSQVVQQECLKPWLCLSLGDPGLVAVPTSLNQFPLL